MWKSPDHTAARAAALALLLAAAPAAADQKAGILTPIQPEIDAGAELRSYVARCGGFYLSVFEWLGPARLGEASANGIRDSVAAIVHFEAQTTHADLDSDAALDAAEDDIRAAANEYVKYYSALYTDAVEPFTTDPLVQADNATCQAVLGGLGQ